MSLARARLRVGYPWWLRPFVFRDVAGITLGRRIYVAPQIDGLQFQRLVRHEFVHVRQIARLGLFTFYWRYAVEYVGNRRRGMPPAAAYRNISFEKEAFAAEETV
jgi:hypothetical protein